MEGIVPTHLSPPPPPPTPPPSHLPETRIGIDHTHTILSCTTTLPSGHLPIGRPYGDTMDQRQIMVQAPFNSNRHVQKPKKGTERLVGRAFLLLCFALCVLDDQQSSGEDDEEEERKDDAEQRSWCCFGFLPETDKTAL